MLVARESGSKSVISVPLGKNSKLATTKIQVNNQNNREKRGKKDQGKTGEKKGSSACFRSWLAFRQRQEIIAAGLWSSFKTLCTCGKYPIPAFTKSKKMGENRRTGAPGCIQMAWYDRDAADGDDKKPLAFTWVKRCASPLLCFMDAPVIRYYRSQEVATICRRMIDLGYSWQFWTFTAPHDLTTDPVLQRRAFQAAMKKMKQDRRWALFKRKWGIEFHITAVEMTDDAPYSSLKSGCHFHYHLVVFCKHTAFTKKEASEMYRFISRRWVDCLISKGLISENKKQSALRFAFKLDLPRQPKNPDLGVAEVGEYISKGAAIELSAGIFVKSGKRLARVSHWQFMALALTRYPEAVPRMLALMKALKGVHWMHFSKGLRALCGIADVSDEEILKKKNSVLVAEIDDLDWFKIDDYKMQKRFIDGLVKSAEEAGCDLSVVPSVNGRLDLDNPDAQFLLSEFDRFIQSMRYGYCPDTGEDLDDAVKSPPLMYV